MKFLVDIETEFKPENKRAFIPERPVVVYNREAANRLIAQGYTVIAIERNLKRTGDASLFLFAPENGKTLKALNVILQQMKKEKETIATT